MENKIDKVITLDDNTKYMIMDQGNYNGKCYFLTSKLSEDDNLTKEISIMEENVVDGVSIVTSVKDEELLKALAKYFEKRV